MITNQPPWMAALEAQLGALSVANLMLELGDGDGRVEKELQTGWAIDKEMLTKAAPFAWSEETTRAVLEASRSIPLDTEVGRWNLATPMAFWRFETPLPFQTITRADVGIRALCFGWVEGEGARGMPCHTWLDDPEGRWPLIPGQTWGWLDGLTLTETLVQVRERHERLYGPGGAWAHKKHIGVDAFMAATEGVSRFILAGLAWLDQKVLVTDAGHAERHRRKEFNRRTGQDLRAVQVVQLRKNEYPPREPGESEVEWSCRWSVSGHWRNQPCGPKRGDRRLRYILPFVKGPSDKPFRESPKKVYEVRR